MSLAFEPSDFGEEGVADSNMASYTDTIEVTSGEAGVGDKTSSEEEDDSAVEQCSGEGSSQESGEELEGEVWGGVRGRGRGRGRSRGREKREGEEEGRLRTTRQRSNDTHCAVALCRPRERLVCAKNT